LAQWLKNAAFDVDLEGEKVRIPERIGVYESRQAILSVEWFLERYHALPEAMRAEESWSSFSAMVRSRVSR
jgi:hypothetical protein